MQELLQQRWVHAVVVPVILVLIGAVATSLGRRDGNTSPRINDWAVCTITLLMTLSAIASDIYTNRANTEKVLALVAWVFGMMFLVLTSINHDRYTSWKLDDTGAASDEKHLVWGVLLPNFISILLFALYRYSLGR